LAMISKAPGSPRPVRARWPAPAPSERGKQPRVTALLSAPGSALVWATYGAPGSPVGVAIYDIAAGRQVAWRRRMGLATPLDLRSLALDPAGRCLYALRTPDPNGDDSPGGEALALTPLLTRVGARLSLDGDRAGAALAVRPSTGAAG
ncbi:MAG: hypothetical protein NTZ05_08690, partial [Chloroflexi bacterium]|nr:hypothetical protein [Chloroflexota bacterium]